MNERSDPRKGGSQVMSIPIPILNLIECAASQLAGWQKRGGGGGLVGQRLTVDFH